MSGRIVIEQMPDENGEHTGSGAWTARISSPCSIISCVLALAAGALAGFSIAQSAFTAGAVSQLYAGMGLCGMPVSILGLWLGVKGRYDRQEKRQLTGLIGCVANGTVFILLAGIYGVGLFWQS